MKGHEHIIDIDGNRQCCLEQVSSRGKDSQVIDGGVAEIDKKAPSTKSFQIADEDEQATSSPPSHIPRGTDKSLLSLFLPAIFSFLLLSVGLTIDHLYPTDWFTGWVRLLWYIAAYVPVGFAVNRKAIISIGKGNIFSEFFLMSIATLGAFAIGVYPEGVAVMLFYTIGEIFQDLSLHRARLNIQALLHHRPSTATILSDGKAINILAERVEIGDIIQLKPGDKLALDGELLSSRASFNAADLTGESVPIGKYKGEEVLAGMINLKTASQVKVTREYKDSKLSKILELVQGATAQKAPTELFISKFAAVYTPIVVFLAIALCFLPALFVQDYIFSDWLYRSLIFLVVSCPCALVISIPLGYFGGIGAASKNGILVKGSNFLDALATAENVVMDKTGMLTEGIFSVREVKINPEFNEKEVLHMVNALESISSHPVSSAIHDYVGKIDSSIKFDHMEEIAGYGVRGLHEGKEILVGSFSLLEKFGVSSDFSLDGAVFTAIAIAYDRKFVGYLVIADRIKADTRAAIEAIHKYKLKTTILSGDRTAVVKEVAEKLGVEKAYGDLLPHDKMARVIEIQARNESVIFAGDGVNDAPVIALSDVGIAMGGLGSDLAIETADVVILDDKPSKIPMAIAIGKETKKIVWQNIALAFGVKAIVLILGAGGIATLWEAVFADVGVALLAIFNAIRIQRMRF